MNVDDIDLELQIAISDCVVCPDAPQFHSWANAVMQCPQLLSLIPASPQLSVRLVDEAEGADLNQQWRNKTGATNVLSFPFEPMAGLDLGLLGDIVLCVPVVQREAIQQNKPVKTHFAHLLIHGLLHLLGFDHLETGDAVKMEQLEIEIMATLGYTNPYA